MAICSEAVLSLLPFLTSAPHLWFCFGEGLEVIDEFISFYSRTLTTTLLTDDGKSFWATLDTGQKIHKVKIVTNKIEHPDGVPNFSVPS